MKKSKIIEYIKNPKKIWNFLVFRNIVPISDEEYLKMKYKFMFEKDLDLKNPKTFNEKLQWLKLNDRKPIYTTMVDKYEVKKYVANIIGREHIIPTIGIYNKFNDIDFNILPNKFVIKCTHDSGGLIICNDKEKLNINDARKKINNSLKNNYYKQGREWPYKNVKPRILIENHIGENLTDYRIYCFNGKSKYIYMYISENKENNTNKPEPSICNIYNTEWELQDFRQKSPISKKIYEKPRKLNEMLELAENLAKDTTFLRVDFYIIDDMILFSELTFFPGGGFSKFNPNEMDLKLGEMLNLNNN